MGETMDLYSICFHGVGYALFDMDGTLLDGDLGETTFLMTLAADHLGIKAWDISLHDLLAAEDEIAQLPTVRRYAGYLSAGDHTSAYQMTTKYMERLPYFDIMQICRWAFIEFSNPATHLTVDSLRLPLFVLTSQRMLSYVFACAKPVLVSASPRSVVQAFAYLYDLGNISIIASEGGIETLPYGEAKVRLAKERGITRPFVAFGNSEGDREMLNWAELGVFRSTQASPSQIESAKSAGWTIIDH
jgi:phosphoserine phosphatase